MFYGRFVGDCGFVGRAELFSAILNEKLRNKEIKFSVNEGLELKSNQGEKLLPEQLSSGEQHEIIMFYTLIFQTSPETVVLIDEPETSLHIAWQEVYLDHLAQVQELNGFQAVVSTHSPDIIGDRRDLMIGIGYDDQ